MDFEQNNIPQEEESPIPTAPETLQEEVPTEEASPEVFELSEPLEQPKKQKTVPILTIIAVVAAIALVVGLLLSLGVFQKSPHEAMVAAEKEALYQAVDTLAVSVGQYHTFTEKAPSTSAEMDMHLLLSDNLLDFLGLTMTQMGADIEFDWLKDIALHFDIDNNGSQLRYLGNLGLGDKEIAQLDMILDLEKAAMYLGTPGLNPYYLTSDFEGADVLTMQKSQELTQAFMEALPEEAALRSSLRSYVDLLLTLLKDPQEGKETVMVDGLEQSYTTVTYQITEQQLRDFVKAAIEQSKNDETLKQLLTAFGNYTASLTKAMDADPEQTDLYAEFLKALEEVLADLDAQPAQEGNSLELVGYLDSKQKLRGHKLILHSAASVSYPLLNWLTADEGDAERVQILVYDGDETILTVTGTQTEKRGLLNGTYRFKFSDGKALTLEVKDLQFNKENYLCGSILLTPNSALLREIFGDSYMAIGMVLGNDLGLRLDMKESGDSGSFGFHLTSDGETVIGMTLDASYRKSKEIQLPAEDILLTGEDAADRFAEAFDLETLMKKLEEAGVPLDLLQGLVQGLLTAPDTAA